MNALSGFSLSGAWGAALAVMLLVGCIAATHFVTIRVGS